MATRDELNKEATELGLNPDDYANIGEITEAIEAERARPTGTPTVATDVDTSVLADDTPVEFEHADGRRYGGTYKAFTELYEPAGFTITGRGDGQPLNPAVAPE
jgi:hypothetical protein